MPNGLDLAYLGLLLVCSPLLLARAWRRGKYREGWAEKLRGRVPRRIGDSPCLWLHAVSVGEVLLLRPLVAEIHRRRPDWDVVVSTTTPTGLDVARRTFPELVTFYAPLDFSWSARRAVERIRPTALVLVETELWPNLIRAASAPRGARVAVINGRLSRRSHRGYRRFRALLAPILRRLDAVAAQSAESADRFRDIGVPADRVTVTGSIKYDGLESDRQTPKVRSARRELGLDGSAPVFVAGSTMEGEEAAALLAYRAARADHPGLRLVIAPRHPDRGDELARWIESEGMAVWRRSIEEQPPAAIGPDEPAPVLLIDTVGELSSIWGLADVAFVGGSLYPGRGGQNMMEPSAFGASVLFGPHTSNFREAAEGLLDRNAARLVRDPDELAEALRGELAEPATARARGASARSFVLAQRGATDRTLAMLDLLVGRRGRATRAPGPASRTAAEAAQSAA